MKGRIKSNLSNRDIEQRLDEIKYIDRKLREWCRLYEKYPDKTWDAGEALGDFYVNVTGDRVHRYKYELDKRGK